MLRNGYAPAKDVAEVLCKSLMTVHRMVDAGQVAGMLDGGVLYILISGLEKHYAQNSTMLAAVRRLRAEPPPRRVAR